MKLYCAPATGAAAARTPAASSIAFIHRSGPAIPLIIEPKLRPTNAIGFGEWDKTSQPACRVSQAFVNSRTYAAQPEQQGTTSQCCGCPAPSAGLHEQTVTAITPDD